MEWTEAGTLEVREDGAPCVEGCSRCLTVCPFGQGNADEDELGKELFGGEAGTDHTRETGYFRKCFAGYSKVGGQRAAGASGGLATWYLTELLRRGDVDAVACVLPHPGPRPLFTYAVLNTVAEVEAAARSAYYPVEMSQVLREIRGSDGRVAVVGLPCFLKALRLACRADRRLNHRIVQAIGLTCGHGATALFAEYCDGLAGLADPAHLQSVRFRNKTPGRPASDHRIDLTAADGRTPSVHWSEGPGEAWSGWWFVPHACLYCDDVFAECADVAFMDAWLPQYTSDHRGTNMVLVRSAAVEEILAEGASAGKIILDEIGVDLLLRAHAGVVRQKRAGLAQRLWREKRAGAEPPTKRIAPERARGLRDGWEWAGQARAAREGPRAWRTRRSLRGFQARMRRLTWWRSLRRTIRRSLPWRLVGRLVGAFRR
jgi:coenzyme F420-reducing hydrogenase beta subunit